MLRRLFRRDPLRAKAWTRREHPPLDAAGRAELQRMITEQADRVRAALTPFARPTPGGLTPMHEVIERRRQAAVHGYAFHPGVPTR